MAERSFALIKTDTIGLKTFILGQTKITCIANKKIYAITFIRYSQNRKIGKPNNLSFGSNKTKGPKQDN